MQLKNRNELDNMLMRNQRFEDRTNITLASNNRDKVRFDDLENLKHDHLGVSSNLLEKIDMVNKRLLEYEVRMNYVENHCFNK